MGVPADLVEAWQWLQLAAAQKFPAAAQKRDELAAKMTTEQLANARDKAAHFGPSAK